MEKIKKCEVCGREFVAGSYGRKYCDNSCKVIANRKMARERERKKRRGTYVPKQFRKVETVKKINPITEIAIEARKAGMSYGQYVSKMGL